MEADCIFWVAWCHFIERVLEASGFVSRDRQGVLPIGAHADRSEPGMKTFIRIAEIWVPTKDRTQLEFGDGLYGPLGEFRSASRGMRFGFDEGLPGWAWAAGHPVVMTKFDDSHFKRGAAAKFEFNAKHTKFPRGYGLPGRAWKANMPTIEKDLLNSKSFLRSQQAA